MDSVTLESGDNLSHHVARAFEQFSRLKMAGEAWTDDHKKQHLIEGLTHTPHANMISTLKDPNVSVLEMVKRLHARELRLHDPKKNRNPL